MKPALKDFRINTNIKVKDDGIPRQPNDRDESPDGGEIQVHDDIKQAYDDLQRGLVDTDLHGVPGVEKVVDKTRTNTPENPGTPVVEKQK